MCIRPLFLYLSLFIYVDILYVYVYIHLIRSYVYVCIYIHICICLSLSLPLSLSIHIYTFIYLYIYIYVHKPVHGVIRDHNICSFNIYIMCLLTLLVRLDCCSGCLCLPACSLAGSPACRKNLLCCADRMHVVSHHDSQSSCVHTQTVHCLAIMMNE